MLAQAGDVQRLENGVLRQLSGPADVHRQEFSGSGGHQQPAETVLLQVEDLLAAQEHGEIPPGHRVQGKAPARPDPKAVVAVYEQGTHLVRRQRMRVRRVVEQVIPGVIVEGQDADPGRPIAQDEPLREEGEGLERGVAVSREILGVVAGEGPRGRVQPIDARPEGADPDRAVRRLFQVGDVVVGELVLPLSGPVEDKGAGTLVIAGQAAFLERHPHPRLLAVRQDIVDQVDRESVRLLQEGARADPVETVESLFRGHPDQVVRIHGHGVDETVGQADLLRAERRNQQRHTNYK